MAKERKLRGRAKRASYFAPAASGGYVYTGPLYSQLPDQKLTWRQAMARRWAMGMAIGGLVILCGCVPVQGMVNTAYVILPYAAEVVAAASLVWAVCRIHSGGERLREYVYEAAVCRLPTRAVLTAVFAGVTLAGEAVSLFLDGLGGKSVLWVWVFLLSQAVILGMSLIWRRMEKGILWGK